MVRLSEEDVEKFATPIGRVVLYFAELESALSELQKTAAEALLTKDMKQDIGKFQWSFGDKIAQILTWLEKLREDDITKEFVSRKQSILKTADDRHHIVHGQWWLLYMDRSVNTAKPHPRTGELEYREWTIEMLSKVVWEIRDHEAYIYRVNRMLRERWLGEDTFSTMNANFDHYDDDYGYEDD